MNPEALQQLQQPLIDTYLAIENELMQNIAKHLGNGTAVGTNQWNIEKLQELNALHKESYDILVQGMEGVDYDLYQALKIASEANLEATNSILNEAVAKGLIQQPFFRPQNTVMMNILDSYFRDAKEKFNLVNTTMLQGTNNEYIKILNKTTGAVLTGISTPQEALRQSVREFADKGLPGLIDKSGRQWTPEAYIDNVIRSTSNNVANEMQFARMDEYDVDLIEVSSHVGARPKCEPFQGRIFSKSGKNKKYPPWASTTYGDPGGLLGCNCRHVIYAFIEGVSTKRYEPVDHEKNKKVYEESQIQRKIERDIRKAKREKEMFEKLGDQDGVNQANQKIKANQAKMRTFIGDTGRTRKPDREQIVAYNGNGGIIKPQPSRYQFNEAKTTNEAKDYAQNVLGIKQVSYKGVDVATANEWNRGLAESFNRFPELKDNFGFTGECHERNVGLKNDLQSYFLEKLRERNPGVSDDVLKPYVDKQVKPIMRNMAVSKYTFAESYSPRSDPYKNYSGVTVNRDWGKDYNKFVDSLKQTVDSKFHPVGCDTVKSVLDHEIGHQLDAMLDVRNQQSIQYLYRKHNTTYLTENLSTYAWRNDNPNPYSEFIAEGWAEYLNNPKPRPIAAEIGKTIERLYDEWKKKNS